MTQERNEEVDPIEAYWTTHHREPERKLTDWEEMKRDNPGYAYYQLGVAVSMWVLIILIVISILQGAEASGTGKKKKKGHAYNPPIEQPEPKKACAGPVRVVGSQWANDAGAEESAQKAWSEAVRFNHGEAFMDLSNAIGYQKRCSRSSIGEVIGQSLHRCEVDAVPCRPPFSAEASK